MTRPPRPNPEHVPPPVAEDLAEYLNGEWPHLFNDGFQDAVAAALLEAFAIRRSDALTVPAGEFEAYRSGPYLHMRHKPCGQSYPFAATSAEPISVDSLNAYAAEHECPVRS